MLSNVKTEERRLAEKLRRERGGMSVREIALAVSVSRGTASLWLRAVPLTRDQKAALHARNPAYSTEQSGARANADQARARRRTYQAEGRRRARTADPGCVAGCMLYWAEGSNNRNVVRFTNSEPAMVRFFTEFLRSYFRVADERLRVWCNLYADHVERQLEIEDLWLNVVGAPRSCLYKSTVKSYSKYSARKPAQRSSVRNLPRKCRQHRDRANHPRVDPGARRLRAARLARLVARHKGRPASSPCCAG
jgi:hypothetical protein